MSQEPEPDIELILWFGCGYLDLCVNYQPKRLPLAQGFVLCDLE